MISDENIICSGCGNLVEAGHSFVEMAIWRLKFGRRVRQMLKFCTSACGNESQLVINEKEAAGYKPVTLEQLRRKG